MGLVTTVSAVPPPRDTVRGFARWVASACEPGTPVLDVGAGCGAPVALHPVLRRRPYLVGVDPDAAVERNACVAERHRMSLECFAESNPARFDVVFSVYVLEHVSDPTAFTAAVSRVLRPGGRWYGLTLNTHHYFGGTTWALSRVNAAGWLLDRLKGDALDHEHHFPTSYRMNSVRALRRCCTAAGFESLEVRCYDATERYQWYLPQALRWFPPAYTRVAYGLGRPGLMGHLTFEARKPLESCPATSAG